MPTTLTGPLALSIAHRYRIVTFTHRPQEPPVRRRHLFADAYFQIIVLAALAWLVWPHLSRLWSDPIADAARPISAPGLDPARWRTGPQYPDEWLDGTVPTRATIQREGKP